MNSDYQIKTRNLNKPPLPAAVLRPAPKRKKKWHEPAVDLFYWIGTAVAGLSYFLFRFDHFFGFGVVRGTLTFSRKMGRDFHDTRWVFLERVRILRQPEFRASIFALLLLTGVVLSALKSASLVAYGQQIKTKVLGIAVVGGDHLKQAQGALENQDFQKAQNEFLLAQASFKNSKAELDQANGIVKNLSNLLPQKRDAERLLEASSLISQSGARLLDFQAEAKKLKMSQGGLEVSGEKTSDVLSRLYDSISDSSDLVEKAEKEVGKINIDNIPSSHKPEVLLLKDNIKYISSSLRNLRDVFGLLKIIFTGKKQVLLLFENNNELRATGGFIGTYGAMVLENGKITSLHISSVYELDGQLKEKILPPSPLLNVNDRWYLRDSNWFADFPESAKKISSFYEKEGGETPDLVVAVTAGMVEGLLGVTGPVEMPSYGVTLSEDNFIETTQVETSLLREHATNNPKQLLADFFPVLLQKLSTMPGARTPALLEALNTSFNSKNVVLYSRDAGVQKQFEAFGWAGTVSNTDRDYLSIVTSNLGGTKTDTYISQVVDLNTKIEANGDITNTLTLSRANMLPRMDKAENLSFIRVLVPEGSQLLEVQGFDYKNFDSQKIPDRKKDIQGAQWEKSVSRQNVSGTYIGKESGKTFFGNWLEVKPGETRTVTLVYRLPFKLREIDRYSLFLQKQMGAENARFNYQLEFEGKRIAWKNFATEDLQASHLSSNLLLDKDYFLGLVLTSQQD